MLNYLKLNKFAVTMFAQSRTYNRKSGDKNKTKYRINNPFGQLFLLFFQNIQIRVSKNLIFHCATNTFCFHT